MLLRSFVICVFVSLASSATLSKKNSYGSDPNYGVPSVSSYGSGGVSGGSPAIYDPSSSSAAVVGAHSSYGGNSGVVGAAVGNADSNAYANSGSASSYGGGSNYGNSDGYGSSSGGTGGGGGNSADSYGNLYYYYYPVTNHTSSGSNAVSSYSNAGVYGGGGGMGGYGNGGVPSYGGGGGGSGSYYPPAPIGGGYGDPLGGLLSVISSVDINSLILPILLIGGVALLLPAILNCDLELGTCVIPLPAGLAGQPGRRSRRGVDYDLQQLSIAEMVQHAYNIYEAVQQSEQCMERVVCEVGGMMSNVRGKETFFSVMEHFASPYMKKQLRVLKEGAIPLSQSSLDASLSLQSSSCHKFACGKLQQLTTNNNYNNNNNNNNNNGNDNQLEE